MLEVSFRPLTEVRLADLVTLMSHPLVRRQMPLVRGSFTIAEAEGFVAGKQRLWTEHGYGPWAFVIDGTFAGWGGLQYEAGDADLGLVLHPRYWGYGPTIARRLLVDAFDRMGLPSVTVLLPPTRRRLRPLFRLGFVADGEVELDGERFRRYRLAYPRRRPGPERRS